MKKRILSVLLTLVMLIGILPTAAFAAEDTAYDIWVIGTQITSDNLTVNGDTGTATYDPATNTLTLDNFQFKGDADVVGSDSASPYAASGLEFSCSAVISALQDLNIVLKGDNSLRNTCTTGYYNAAILGGTGSTFNIVGENGSYLYAEAECGIYVSAGTMTLDNVTCDANSASQWGTITADTLTIKNGSDLTFTNMNNDTGALYGDDITIVDSKVIANGLKYGIELYGGDLIVTNSEVTAAGTLNAIYCRFGNLEIKNSTVNASIPYSSNFYVRAAIDVSKNILVEKSYLTVTTGGSGSSKTYGMDADSITFDSSVVTIDSYTAACNVTNGVTINNEVVSANDVKVETPDASTYNAAYITMAPSVTVTYNYGGVLPDERVELNGAFTLPTPTVSDKVLSGWFTDSTYTTAFDVRDLTNVTGDITIYAKFVTPYDLLIGDVQVHEDNQDDVLGNGRVSFDPNTNTLTLNGANISSPFNGIDAQMDLTIVLKRSNTIKSDRSAIYVSSNLTIEGSGSLTADATDSGGWDCISVGGNLTINGGTVDTTGSYYGIYTVSGITISGGTVNATGEGGINTGNNITINGGTVTATGDEWGGLYADSDVIINGGTVKATSYARDGYGVLAGAVTINDGTIEAISPGENGYGIVTYDGVICNSGLGVYAGESAPGELVTSPTELTYISKYVKITPICTVTVNYGMDGVDNKEITVTMGDTISLENPVVDGYIFIGWYADADFTTAFDFTNPITEDVTVYAKFADYEGDKAALQDAIDALETAVGNVETALNNKVSTEKLTEEIGKLNQAIADAKAYADTQDAALKTTLEAADATMNAAITELQNRVTALETGLNTANGKIDTNISDVGTLKTDVSTLKTWKTDAQNAIIALQGLTNTQGTSISALQAAVADLQTAVSTANSNIAAAEVRIAALEGRVTDLEAAKAALESAVADLENAVATKADTTTLNEKVDALNTAITNAEKAAKDYADAQDVALKSALETAIEAAKDEAISAAETLVNNAKAELQSKINTKADAATTTEAIQNLQAAVAALEAAKNNYIGADDALRTELEGKIATAKGDAISAAETLVNNAKAELQSKINAKADAATTTEAIQNLQAAVAALEAVKDDYATADATLKADLESKIATAKSDAITAANTALTTAKNELSQAIALKADTATLNAKVDALNIAIANAESVAKAYADTQDAALKAELQTAIANAKSEAIGAAQILVDNAKAALQTAIDTKADTATVNAAIANLQNAITALEAAKDNYISADAALKLELEAAIERAKQEAIEAAKGYIPYIGTNGNWWIGESDTGIKVEADNGLAILAIVIGSLALVSNIALAAWLFIKKKNS